MTRRVNMPADLRAAIVEVGGDPDQFTMHHAERFRQLMRSKGVYEIARVAYEDALEDWQRALATAPAAPPPTPLRVVGKPREAESASDRGHQ